MFVGDLRFPPIAVRASPFKDGWNIASHAVIEGKPRTQGIAPASRTISLDLFLHAEWMHPQQTIDRLRVMANAFEVVVVQAESGLVYGQFVIDGIDVRPRWMLPDETLVSASVSVTLTEAGLETLLEVPEQAAVEGTAQDVTEELPPEGDTSGDPLFGPAFERWPG